MPAPDPKDQPILDELRARLPSDLPIDAESFFPAARGFGVKRFNERRLTYLTNVTSVLKVTLQPGERIRFVTLGIVNFNWEVLMMGVWAQLINRSVIVLTDQRLLMIHADSKGKPSSFVNQVRLEAVKKVSRGFLGGALVIKSASGTRTFTGIPKVDGKAMVEALPKNPQAAGGFEFLCPGCFTPSAQHIDQCPACHTTFKSPRTAAFRSLFLPGLGDWYLGHRILASMEMLGSAMVWLVVFALLSEGMEALPFAIGLLVIANVSDAALTYFQARKGLMSMDAALPTGHFTAGVATTAPPPIASS